MKTLCAALIALVLVPVAASADTITLAGFSTGTLSYTERCSGCALNASGNTLTWGSDPSTLTAVPYTFAGSQLARLTWDDSARNVLPLDLTWTVSFSFTQPDAGSATQELVLAINANNGLGADDKIVFPDLSEMRFVLGDYVVSGFGYAGDDSFNATTRTWARQSGSSDLFLTATVAARSDVGPDPAPVPEPASMVLLGSGLIGLAALARRKRVGRKV